MDGVLPMLTYTHTMYIRRRRRRRRRGRLLLYALSLQPSPQISHAARARQGNRAIGLMFPDDNMASPCQPIPL